MPTPQLERVERTWPDLASILFVPHTKSEYDRLVTLLDALIDHVSEDETHLLASPMEVVGALIQQYVDAHVSELA